MIKIPEKQQYVIDTLNRQGFKAYIVGGCVRDALLEVEPHDYDVTTNALPQDVQRIFKKTVPTGIKHGTITVVVDKEPIEVTTFRTEGGYTDSRHPDSTEFVSDIDSDLARRDFTVNAMAYNNTDGLIDLYDGKRDLENKVLRAVGVASERFSEDALRILRLFRFASQLDFSIEEETLESAIIMQNGLLKISRERIFAELWKAVAGKNPKALAPVIRSGGLEFLGFKNLPDFEIIKRCNGSEKRGFFAFLYLSTENIPETLDGLKVSNALKDYCKVMQDLVGMKFPENKTDIKEMLKVSDTELFYDYLTFMQAVGKDTSGIKVKTDEILKNGEPYRISHLAINGGNLTKMGYSGADVGKVLEILRRYVTENPEKNTRQDLMEWVRLINKK